MNTPIDPQWAMLVVIIGIQGIAGIVTAIATAVNVFKRRPPLEQDIYQKFLTRADHAERCASVMQTINGEEERTGKALSEIFGQLRSLNSGLKDQLAAQSTRIEASLTAMGMQIGTLQGRIEGHIEADRNRVERRPV